MGAKQLNLTRFDSTSSNSVRSAVGQSVIFFVRIFRPTHFQRMMGVYTVNLRSERTSREGNALLDLSRDFFSYSFIGYKGKI